VPLPSDPPPARPLPLLSECDYSAFVSYAHADDTLAYGWIGQFRTELERNLRAYLRGISLPRLHLSGDNSPIAGALGAQLRQRIERSFAMIIVVHMNYAQSEWCLRELEVFKELFGAEGVRQRLYVLALSEPAMLTVAQGPAWRGLMPGDDAVWLPFHDRDDTRKHIAIYNDDSVVSSAFRVPFERLRDDLAAKLKAAAAAGPARAAGPAAVPIVPSPPPPAPELVLDLPLPVAEPPAGPVTMPQGLLSMPPVPAPPPPAIPEALRIYIESNRHEPALWEPLGEQIQRKWDELCLQLAPQQQPPLALRARGLPVDQLERFPSLDDADGVVLLWGRKTSDTLVAQIDKVERRTTHGRDAAPGIVAYLMPPQEASEPVPAWGWQVLRFDARDEDTIDVIDEERTRLERFLKKAHARWVQRGGVLQR
jgi:hypothetical protein